MSRNSLCQWILLQRPWLVSIVYTAKVPQVSLVKIIQEEGNLAREVHLKLNITWSWTLCSRVSWPALSNVQLWLDCFLHNFSSLYSSAGSYRQASSSTEISTMPSHCSVVPLSFHEVSPYTASAPLFLGSLFKLLLALGWHLYLRMEIS